MNKIHILSLLTSFYGATLLFPYIIKVNLANHSFGHDFLKNLDQFVVFKHYLVQ